MELQRDNQKDKGLSNIPYNPDLFHNDRDFYLSYRKIENIVAAVFLITGLIEQDVLIKNAIREHSLACLNKIVALIGKSQISVTDIQSVASHVLHLGSLLDVAFWSGQVSQMNLSIVQREIATTYKTLNDLSTKYKNTFYIGSSFFKSDLEIMGDTMRKDTPKPTPSPVQKDETKRLAEVFKRQIEDGNSKDNSGVVTEGQEKEATAQSSESREQRREAILSLLRQRSNLSVKDFTTVVTQYSEKTIQRELLALVDEGIVRKEGERRWSTYSLAT